MHCPICNAEETKVIDSRLIQEGSKVRRRRECLNPDCGTRFTTFEVVELTLPMIIKHNGAREEFSALKVKSGLLRAIEKRPVSVDSINRVINSVEKQLLRSSEREIPSWQIGQWVMNELKEIDHVAYLRFASVYLSFQDIEAFLKTIEELQAR